LPFRIRVGEVEYVVDLPAYAIPYVNLLGNGLAGNPQNLGSAKQLAEDLKTAIEELDKFITPKPREEHRFELIFKLIAEVGNEIRRAVKAAGFSTESTETR